MGKTFKDRRKFDRKQQGRDEPVRGPARRDRSQKHPVEENDEDFYDYDDFEDYGY